MMRSDPYAFRDLHRGYRACRRHKRATYNALAFEIDAEAKLLDLQRELRAHSYRPGRSVCFVTGGPKPREVFAADFRDRVVHHLLVAHLERVFEPSFIHDSYACRTGKGTLAASDQLTRFLRQLTANGRRPGWALKLDVASFFASIHKDTLYGLITARVAGPELRWLTGTILFHDPTSDYRFRSLGGRVPGPASPGYAVPPAKSLFGAGNARGLPIGNLTSQFWANVYLDALDQFVKRQLRCRWYVRYVDDLVLLADDPQQLRSWRESIAGFLAEPLRLALRAEVAEPRPVRDGVTFVGWRTWWSHRVPRRQTLGSLRRRLGYFERTLTESALAGAAVAIDLSRRARPPAPRAGRPARPVLQQLHATLAAYSGHLRQGAAYQVWVDTWERHASWLGLLCRRTGWTIEMRWRAPSPWYAAPGSRAPPLARVYRHLLHAAGSEVLVFLQVGRFIELYGPQRVLAEQVLALRAAHLPRAGFGLTAGFPRARLRDFVARAIGHGWPVVLVMQHRCLATPWLIERVPRVLWAPAGVCTTS